MEYIYIVESAVSNAKKKFRLRTIDINKTCRRAAFPNGFCRNSRPSFTFETKKLSNTGRHNNKNALDERPRVTLRRRVHTRRVMDRRASVGSTGVVWVSKNTTGPFPLIIFQLSRFFFNYPISGKDKRAWGQGGTTRKVCGILPPLATSPRPIRRHVARPSYTKGYNNNGNAARYLYTITAKTLRTRKCRKSLVQNNSTTS